ncbi:MAG TPA: glycosyltransferase, partial [Anaerolineales bacterium]|nr:glycosyltransferase [Anaerolineales bacterium]
VTVAAPAAFEGLIRRAGLRAFRVEPDPRLHAVDGEPPRWLRSSALVGAVRLLRAMLPGTHRSVTFVGYLAASRKADIILHPAWLAPAAGIIAQMCGCLALPAYLTPIHPTRTFPSPFLDVPSHPSWNHSTHVLALWLGRVALAGLPMHWPPQAGGLPSMATGSLPREAEPCLYGFPRSLLRPPADWPPGIVVTGPWWLDAPDDWRPPPDLDRFLQTSGKVIFLGFGSMMDSRPGELNATVTSVLTRLGCRAVLYAGPRGQLALPDSPQWLIVHDIPFDWLFPRVDAIVHHGGAGTAAQVARAGKPSIAVPYFPEQHFWSRQIHRAGGGSPPIARRALTSERLATEIDKALHDPSRAEKAAFLGTQVRAETGLSTAVTFIEAR